MYAAASFWSKKYLCSFLKGFLDKRISVTKENDIKMKGENEKIGNLIEFERGNFTIVMALCPGTKSICNDLLYAREESILQCRKKQCALFSPAGSSVYLCV